MTITQSLWRVLIIAALSAAGMHAHGQASPPQIDPAISGLAARLAETLRKAHAKKVVVAELQAPEGLTHPFGKYLADRLSESLQRDFPDLEVIDRSQQPANASGPSDSADPGKAMEKTKAWARALGANFVIIGSFSKFSQGIGVSLSAQPCNHSSSFLGLINGLVPITDEITALSLDPIPSPQNGILRGGTGGTTIPICGHCPVPDFTDKARAAKFEGAVVLEVVVGADGQVGQVIVTQGIGYGLDENAVKAVKKWKLKPALGPDGKPVQVRVPIEVTFRLR
jgi:TonB family protein